MTNSGKTIYSPQSDLKKSLCLHEELDIAYSGPATVYVVERIKKSYTLATRKWLKRRAATEPEIGHMKNDGCLGKNHPARKFCGRLNAILCGCGHNIRKMLNFLRPRPQPAT